MRGILVASVAILVVASQISFGLTSTPSTVPAFLWSSHHYESSYAGMKDTVDYRTISPTDFTKLVLSEGGWSNLLFQGKNNQAPDVALVFAGREMQSSDISVNNHADPDLVDLLKNSFTKSNFSMAFPYVTVSEEKGTIQNSLISGFRETCGHKLGVKDIAFLGSCSIEGLDFTELADVNSVQNYLGLRMEKKSKEKTTVIMVCNDQSQPEGELFSELISSIEQLGATYTALYASDPYRLAQYTSYRELDRFLAEAGNGSVRTAYCDGVCQIKSSLLEGFLVALVLLIILISGLCCMMGIDTPTRFAAPQE
ncbi:hypothetical protein MKX01_029674 [Papaver californicum]|nr:hypothetical protein MKX01_029674 [Papaver californicum]